jgi:hypothetical protein
MRAKRDVRIDARKAKDPNRDAVIRPAPSPLATWRLDRLAEGSPEVHLFVEVPGDVVDAVPLDRGSTALRARRSDDESATGEKACEADGEATRAHAG